MMKSLSVAAVLFLSIQTFATETASSAKSPPWQTACYSIDDDVLKEELTEDGNTWKHRHIAYEKENCEVSYLFYDNTYKVKQDGEKIDLTFVATEYTPLSSEVAEALNLIRWCGIDGWKKGESQAVSGQECGDFKVPAKGEMIYSIFALKNEGKELFLGEGTMARLGKTPETRHEKLSKRVFTK